MHFKRSAILILFCLSLGAPTASGQSNEIAVYRASMPAPLSAPTAEQFDAARAQQQAARDRRLAQHEPTPPATSISFLARPTARDFEAVYPTDAFRRGVTGRVVLECLSQADGELACAVASEDPAGEGFGEAARRAAARFRLPLTTPDGRTTVGSTISIPMTFRVR